MRVRTDSLVLAGLALLIVGTGACGKKKTRVSGVTPPSSVVRRPSPEISVPLGYTESGLASWYGRPYHGRPAADGEIYDMETLVAAHRTLPFQTVVRVTLLSTGKSVEVRIIDRGPFIEGRILDLSHAAAREIGLIGPGVAQVNVEVIRTAPLTPSGLFAVQVGAFRDENNADRAVLRMTETYGAAKKVARAGSQPSWRVLAGRLTTQNEAEALANRIRAEQNLPEAFVVRLDP